MIRLTLQPGETAGALAELVAEQLGGRAEGFPRTPGAWRLDAGPVWWLLYYPGAPDEAQVVHRHQAVEAGRAALRELAQKLRAQGREVTL